MAAMLKKNAAPVDWSGSCEEAPALPAESGRLRAAINSQGTSYCVKMEENINSMAK
ncbi:hypothetical protein LRR81_00930 [Metabacillus sp. GX 13764]|uniref:hypothetical protein n=1 Tax=Metabacillus kandeliae TaxID=2900151 RepID=UPI001E434AD0|nr:hypothetical protein [Metabacillus kandeliae]MCD7032773.1 hypothetical protein [Metabacillus kandeliae]